jgi:hypothetical protein
MSARSDHYLFKRWKNMINGCSNPNDGSWKHNGARGVKVCRRWYNFWTFVDDIESNLGPQPSEDQKFLARLDPTKDWKLSNVQWDFKKNYANRRPQCHWVKIGKETKSLSQWCDHFELPYQTVFTRIAKYGWTEHEALEIKARK